MTLVKVIAAVLKFSPQQTQVVLEKETHRKTLVSIELHAAQCNNNKHFRKFMKIHKIFFLFFTKNRQFVKTFFSM